MYQSPSFPFLHFGIWDTSEYYLYRQTVMGEEHTIKRIKTSGGGIMVSVVVEFN